MTEMWKTSAESVEDGTWMYRPRCRNYDGACGESCRYQTCAGCTDPTACNCDASASIEAALVWNSMVGNAVTFLKAIVTVRAMSLTLWVCWDNSSRGAYEVALDPEALQTLPDLGPGGCTDIGVQHNPTVGLTMAVIGANVLKKCPTRGPIRGALLALH